MDKKLLKLNLQHFAEDNTGGDAGNDTGDQQTDDKTDNPFGAQDKDQTNDTDKDPDKRTDDTSQGGDNKDKDPSSEEAQKQAADAYAKTQGYESAEKMQEALKAYKEYQDSQKTEQEKLTNLEKDTQAKDEQLQNANAQISAMKKGVDGEFLEDVILLAKAKTSDDVTMDDAIGQVLERYPHFKGERQQGQGPSFGQDKYQQQSGGSDDFVAGLNLKSIAGGKQ